MQSESVYLVRRGAMGTIEPGRSALDRLERGEQVVVRTKHGLELGEILGPARTLAAPMAAIRIERPASSADLCAAAIAAATAPTWLARCQAIFGDGHWPIAILDVEPLLEPARAVIYYLGPRPLDTEGLCAVMRERFGHEVVFEPVEMAGSSAQASCGSSGCGSCGDAGHEGGRGTSSGCSSCAVAKSVRPAGAGR